MKTRAKMSAVPKKSGKKMKENNQTKAGRCAGFKGENGRWKSKIETVWNGEGEYGIHQYTNGPRTTRNAGNQKYQREASKVAVMSRLVGGWKSPNGGCVSIKHSTFKQE